MYNQLNVTLMYRKQQLLALRQQASDRRLNESQEHRYIITCMKYLLHNHENNCYRHERLQRMQQHSAERWQLQTRDEIQLRQHTDANYSREHRRSTRESQTSIRQQYLHEDGWTNSQNELHHQQWVMRNFHSKQSNWKLRLCSVCHEMWPTQVNQANDTNNSYTCTRCKRDKGVPTRYSQENDMDPKAVPQSLQNLSQVEEMLIARICPIMCVYRKHGGQRGYKGHVINFPQDIRTNPSE